MFLFPGVCRSERAGHGPNLYRCFPPFVDRSLDTVNLVIASIILGIFPMVVYAVLVWRLDRWEKEPIPLMLASFLWGFIPSAVFAVCTQMMLGFPALPESAEPALATQFYENSILAPLTEEFIKGLGVLIVMLWFRHEIDSLLDGLIYGSMIGFGFAAMENILYFLGQPDAYSLAGLFFLRAIVFGMLHAFFTGFTGLGFAMARFTHKPWLKLLWPILGLSMAIFVHALHNAFATIGGEALWFSVLLISLGILGFLILAIVCLFHEIAGFKSILRPKSNPAFSTHSKRWMPLLSGNAAACRFSPMDS